MPSFICKSTAHQSCLLSAHLRQPNVQVALNDAGLVVCCFTAAEQTENLRNVVFDIRFLHDGRLLSHEDQFKIHVLRVFLGFRAEDESTEFDFVLTTQFYRISRL